MKIGESVALDCSIDEVINYRERRLLADADVLNYVPIRFLDGSLGIHEHLADIEDQMSNNGDYGVGSASEDDELEVISGLSAVLLTAEHATNHRRLRADKSEIFTKDRDFGTGSLAKSTAQITSSDAIIAIGRQTGDANRDRFHSLKAKMTEVMSLKSSKAHLAIHGMGRALASNIRDTRGYSIQIGIGPDPSEATRTLVYDYLVGGGQRLGLNMGVNQPHLAFKNGQPELTESGQAIKTRAFAGTGFYKGIGHTTRDHSQEVARELGIDNDFASVQLEISSALRRSPEVGFPRIQDLYLGAAIGYLFVKMAVESAANL